MPDKNPPKCDIELALAAAQISYAIGWNNTIGMDQKKTPAVLQSWEEAQRVIEKKGYSISSAIAPKKILGGNSSTPLSAVCLVPEDNDIAPIVIGFKGTNPALVEDIKADLSLALQGVAGKEYRDAAYQFYDDVRKQYPGRRLVISGHSLGGNLASYVGIKAYAENKEIGMLDIRTFNAAPIKTEYEKILEGPERENIHRHFVNYRSQNDIFSKNTHSFTKDGIAHGHYGDMVTLLNLNPSRSEVHLLPALKGCMPDMLLTQAIGGSATVDDTKKLYQEKLLGNFELLRYKVGKHVDNINKNEPTDKARLDGGFYSLIDSLTNIKKQIEEALKQDDPLLAQFLLIGATDKISEYHVGEELSHLLLEPRLRNANIIADLGEGYKSSILNERQLWIEPTIVEHCLGCLQTMTGMIKTYSTRCVDQLNHMKAKLHVMMNGHTPAQEKKEVIAKVSQGDNSPGGCSE